MRLSLWRNQTQWRKIYLSAIAFWQKTSPFKSVFACFSVSGDQNWKRKIHCWWGVISAINYEFRGSWNCWATRSQYFNCIFWKSPPAFRKYRTLWRNRFHGRYFFSLVDLFTCCSLFLFGTLSFYHFLLYCKHVELVLFSWGIDKFEALDTWGGTWMAFIPILLSQLAFSFPFW